MLSQQPADLLEKPAIPAALARRGRRITRMDRGRARKERREHRLLQLHRHDLRREPHREPVLAPRRFACRRLVRGHRLRVDQRQRRHRVPSELARALGRDYKNVHTDVQALIELGLLEKDERGGLRAPFDEIVIRAGLRKAA